MSRWLVTLFSTVLSTALVLPAWSTLSAAQPTSDPPQRSADRSKQATTELSQVDTDFALQGEYMGRPWQSWHGAALVGLQVVALGDGKFQGTLLRGGLPGAGWDRRARMVFSGQREGSVAKLRGKGFDITVTGNSAALHHQDSGPLGTIRKWNRISPTLDASPPPGAVVQFDGTTTTHFENAKFTPDRLLHVGALTKMAVGDFQIHIEFRTPYMPHARGQGRGNSGVYIQQRYEVQVLDSFGLEGVDNECGGLYKQKKPDVNMCLPPLAWQTYDISFTAARWNAHGQKVQPARITVLHNGEPIHWNYELTAKTGGGKAESPEKLPILLQNHNNPVTFRNIWIVPGRSRSHDGYYDSAFAFQTGNGRYRSEQCGVVNGMAQGPWWAWR